MLIGTLKPSGVDLPRSGEAATNGFRRAGVPEPSRQRHDAPMNAIERARDRAQNRAHSTAHSTAHNMAHNRARLAVVAACACALVATQSRPASAIDTGGANEVVNAIGINASGVGRLNRKIEQKVAECMKAEGFTYRLQTDNAPPDALDGGAANRGAFVKKYGYGISTIIDPAKKFVGDPNQLYVATLSKSERASYILALNGFDPTVDPNGQFTPRSCVGRGLAILGNVDAVQGIQRKFDELTTRINADAGVVKAMREWSGCMKSAGFSYAKDTDVEPDIAKRLAKVVPSASTATLDTTALIKLQKVELTTAKSDWDCSKKHLGIRDKVASQLNKTFVTQNKAVLETVRAVIAGK